MWVRWWSKKGLIENWIFWLDPEVVRSQWKVEKDVFLVNVLFMFNQLNGFCVVIVAFVNFMARLRLEPWSGRPGSTSNEYLMYLGLSSSQPAAAACGYSELLTHNKPFNHCLKNLLWAPSAACMPTSLSILSVRCFYNTQKVCIFMQKYILLIIFIYNQIYNSTHT